MTDVPLPKRFAVLSDMEKASTDENCNQQNVCNTTPLNGGRRRYPTTEVAEEDRLVASLSRVSLGKRAPPSPAMPSAFSLGPQTPGAKLLNSKRHSHQTSPATLQSLVQAAPTSTLLLRPPECQLHHTSDLHQEKAARLDVLCGEQGILRTAAFASLVDTDQARPATMADILRVHEWSYIQHLQSKIKALEIQQQQQQHTQMSPLPSVGGAAGSSDTSKPAAPDAPPISANLLDADTILSVGSYKAACAAAGAVLDAVDQVVNRKFRNAFVAVRPPGHHAGPRGAVAHDGFWSSPQMCSSGFCLLNNVAIAAAYARYTYGRPQRASIEPSGISSTPSIRRIAIVDFDVHHGNGTEAIVRNLTPHQESLPLPVRTPM